MQAFSNIETRAKWAKKEAKRASLQAKCSEFQRPRFELVEANAGNALKMQKASLTPSAEVQEPLLPWKRWNILSEYSTIKTETLILYTYSSTEIKNRTFISSRLLCRVCYAVDVKIVSGRYFDWSQAPHPVLARSLAFYWPRSPVYVSRSFVFSILVRGDNVTWLKAGIIAL